MNTRKILFGIFTFFFFIISFSCSKEDGIEKEKSDGKDGVVLGNSTIVLSNTQMEHIVSAINNELILDASLKDIDLPKVGQILLSSDISDKLPYGFYGKVKQIAKTETGQYKILTEWVPLNEAFKQLKINQEIDLIPQDDQSVFETRSVAGDIFYEVNLPIFFEEGNTSVNGNTWVGLKLGTDIDLKSDYASFTLRTHIKQKIDFILKFEKKIDPKPIPIGKPKFYKPILVDQLVLVPTLQFYANFKAEGSASLYATSTYEREVVSALLWQHKTYTSNVKAIDSSNGAPLQSVGLSIEGSAYEGISAVLELRPYYSQIVKIGLSIQAGLEQNATFDLNLDNLGNTYQMYKDAKLTNSLKLGLYANVEANLFGESAAYSSSLYEYSPIILGEYYLFPEFQNMKVDIDKDKLTANVSTTIKRNLLFSDTRIGLGLYDENKQLFQKSTSQNYYKESKFTNPLQYTFSGLTAGSKYYTCPYVKLPILEEPIAANPSKEFSTSKLTITGKWNFTDVNHIVHCPDQEHTAGEEWEYDPYFIVNQDGTGYTAWDDIIKCVYNEKGEPLTITFIETEENGDVYEYIYPINIIDENTIQLEDSYDDCGCTYLKTFKRENTYTKSLINSSKYKGKHSLSNKKMRNKKQMHD